MTPAPVPYHQLVKQNIEFELSKFVRENKLGIVLDAPIDVYFSDTETFQPDIIFISSERLHIIGEKKIEGAPDLVIEVLFESTAYYDLRHKKDVYEASGVKEYWIVDPIEKTIEIYKSINQRFQLSEKVKGSGKINSRLLRGFSVNLEEIFY